MAATSGMLMCDHRRDSNLLEQKILQPRIGLGDGRRREYHDMITGLSGRCGSVCMQRAPAYKSATTNTSLSSHFRFPERSASSKPALRIKLPKLAEALMLFDEVIEPPPPYSDSIEDNPPHYTFLDNSASPKLGVDTLLQPFESIDPAFEALTALLRHMTARGIDFGDSSNFRQVTSKKKKQASKQNNRDEPKGQGDKEGGKGEDNGGGGGAEGGGSNNGDGGTGEGGGGGDGGDGDGDGGDGGGGGGEDWGGGKKKKGKKKKAAGNEEEERKRQEEEEKRKKEVEEEEEMARKEEDDKIIQDTKETGDAGGSLSWADGDANVHEEWGIPSSTGKKKKKKAKAEPANTFTSEPDSSFPSTFDNIELENNPKIEINFDSGSAGIDGIGGWGNNWSHSGNFQFDLGTAGTTDLKDSTKGISAEDADSWSFGDSSKNKKATSKFGFGDSSSIKETHGVTESFKGTSSWTNAIGDGEFMSSGKKDKKTKKKDGSEATYKDPEAAVHDAKHVEPEATEGPTGDSWGTVPNKDKKKGRKSSSEPKVTKEPLISSSLPGVFAISEEWETFDSKKKQNNKALPAEEEIIEESAVQKDGDVEAEASWGFGPKKTKKKKKGTAEEPAKGEEPAIEIPSATALVGDSTWSSSAQNSTKNAKNDFLDERDQNENIDDVVALDLEGTVERKGGKKSRWGVFEETEKVEDFGANDVVELKPDEPGPELDLEPATSFAWGFPGKKDKKTKKGPVEKTDDFKGLTASVAASPEAILENSWDTAVAKSSKKKGKKGGGDDKKLAEEPNATDVQLLKPLIEDMLDPWNTPVLNDKKSKSGFFDDVGNDPIGVDETAATTKASDTFPSDNYGSWGTSEKKKVKKSIATSITTEELAPLPIPVVPETSEPLGFWGSSTNDKGKKLKKSKFTEPEPEQDLPKIASAEAGANEHLGFGEIQWEENKTCMLSSKDKKKKEKEKEKEKAKEEKVKEKGNKAKSVEQEPTIVATNEDVEDELVEAGENQWREEENWTLSPAEKKKKEKEKAKEEKAKEKGTKSKDLELNPEVAMIYESAQPEQVEPAKSGWGLTTGWGLSSKDKKKKEKEEKERLEREKEEEREREKEETERQEREKEELEQKEDEQEKLEKAIEEKVIEKPKGGKKGKTKEASVASKPNDWMADSTPDSIPIIEEDTWGQSWDASPKEKKKKGGKKDIVPTAPPPAPTPPAQGLTPEPTAESLPNLDVAETDWGSSFGPFKQKLKKDGKRLTKADEAKGEKQVMKEDTFVEPPRTKTKDDLKDSAQEETPAKAAKSFWGSKATTVTAKPKATQEKENGDNEAQDLINFDLDPDEIVDIVEEPMTKGSKSKADKLSKVSSTKDSDKVGKNSDKKKKSNNNVMAAVVDEPVVVPENPDLGFLNETNEEINDGAKADDSWGFWGSKKTSGKTASEPKKEITKQSWTNHGDSLMNQSNEPELSFLDDQPDIAKSTKPSKATTMSTIKPTVKSSVAQRVKALEKEKEKEKALEAVSAPVDDFQSLPKRVSAFGKLKATPTSKTAPSKPRDLSPPPVEEKKASKDSVPGSFPAEGGEDDIIDVITPSPIEKPSNKKVSKNKKEPKMDLLEFDGELTAPPASEVTPAPLAPPTPPPEQVAAKPTKKDRARVVRDEGASSWGFWGASPKKPLKKDAKAKDDADVPIPVTKEKLQAPGLARSKSTKTAKEKEVEKSSAKSSGSEKEKKPEPRPPKSRGSSFGGLFGPPPARARPVRRASITASKNTSHRQSADVDAMVLPSPPAEDGPEMNSKAAKLMGTGTGKLGRKESTRGKQKIAAVPDPYPIDDDDMVLVNGLEDPIINAPIPKMKDIRREKSTRVKPKKEVKPVPEPAEDIVMVEAGPSSDGAELPTLQEALAFAEPPKAPPRLQRSSTSARKPDNKLMGLFGGFRKTRRASETYERPRSKTLTDDDGMLRRKRTVTGGNDTTKRIRRDDRKVRRSEKPEADTNGFVTDAPPEMEVVTEAEVEARRDERREKRASRNQPIKESRETRLREEDDQRVKRQEADQTPDDFRRSKIRESGDKRTRKEEEQELLRKEERRARRAARDERIIKEEPLTRDPDSNLTPQRRSKHREKDDRDLPPRESSRPHRSEHRRSYMSTPMSPNTPDRRSHRDEHRSSHRTPGEKSSSRRKSSAAPVEDYFDPRNGVNVPDLPPLETQDPYLHSGANDHTSSWVKSQISEPPPPPPPEPSVLDPAPVLGGGSGGGGEESAADEDARKALRRQSRRRSRYADAGVGAGDSGGGGGDGERRRRRESRREGVRSSEGSAEQERERERDRAYWRRKSDMVGGGGTPLVSSRGFGGMGMVGGKKGGSWLQKIKGLADGR